MNRKVKIAAEFMPISALLLLTILQLLAHQSHLPSWMTIFVLMVCVLKYLSYKSKKSSVSLLLRTLLVVISTTVFILYYRTNFSVDMAASFLFLACTLKLFELSRKKDILVFILSMFYLSSVSFLFEQGILQTILQLFIIIICFYSLFIIQLNVQSITTSKWLVVRLHISSMFKLISVAIPFVVVLFLFFPRISPLWQMPFKTQTAKVGFSSQLSPGDISELAKSSEPAFRVIFDNVLPERSNLYWRGLILDQFDGRKWTHHSLQEGGSGLGKVDAGRFIETKFPAYQVMLEPHQQKWVFSLEGSDSASSNLIPIEMGLFRLKTDAIQATRYQMVVPPSNLSVKLAQVPTAYMLNEVDRTSSFKRQDLQLPSSRVNPRTQAYIKQLQLSFNDDLQLLVYLLKQFNEGTFFYTLEPPKIGEHFVDEFIFDTKSGFCGHYASSLAYMLRLAGIPSRVVMGYQGGEYNKQSNYLIVSQNDAHAWVEAYLPDVGWLRLDPTAMVSPLRISQGSREVLANESSFSENSAFGSAAMRYGALNWLRLRLDEVSFQWQNLVVNYNQDQQNNFIKEILGGNSLLRIALLFVYLLVGFFLIMLVYLWLKSLSGYTHAEKKYMIWLFILTKFGLKREQGESPRAFLLRIQKTKYKKLSNITAKRTRILEENQYRVKK
jgi:transglutaminase-like putative cysteine protease